MLFVLRNEPLQQSIDGRSPPHFCEHQTSPRRARAHQLLGSGLYSRVEKLVEPMQTKGRQTYFENCFLCSRVLMAEEFLEQSLHFSSPAHLGRLALEAATLPGSFPTQQLCHPAATTAQAGAQPAPDSTHRSLPASHHTAPQSAASEFLLKLNKS